MVGYSVGATAIEINSLSGFGGSGFPNREHLLESAAWRMTDSEKARPTGILFVFLFIYSLVVMALSVAKFTSEVSGRELHDGRTTFVSCPDRYRTHI
jgi:hypothetical protein